MLSLPPQSAVQGHSEPVPNWLHEPPGESTPHVPAGSRACWTDESYLETLLFGPLVGHGGKALSQRPPEQMS